MTATGCRETRSQMTSAISADRRSQQSVTTGSNPDGNRLPDPRPVSRSLPWSRTSGARRPVVGDLAPVAGIRNPEAASRARTGRGRPEESDADPQPLAYRPGRAPFRDWKNQWADPGYRHLQGDLRRRPAWHPEEQSPLSMPWFQVLWTMPSAPTALPVTTPNETGRWGSATSTT